jgi:glycosyltransferase involved in cell wall biosynthesis
LKSHSNSPRLAILCTHPIQYYAPVFRQLSKVVDCEVKVFYGLDDASNTLDSGFKRKIEWDIPLLEGYEYEFVPNVSKSPGTDRFDGIDLPTLHHRIESWGANSLLVYGWNYRAHLQSMRKYKNRLPVLFRGDSTLLDEEFGLKRLMRRLYLTWVYRHIDCALAVGTNNKKYFEAHGVPDGRIVMAPHSVDNARFDSEVDGNQQAADRLRQSLGIDDASVVILFVGKLERKKSPDTLLKAFRKLQHDRVHLVYVGTGEMENELRAMATSRVHFLGFQNQSMMPVMYRVGDVVVLPSRGPGETWGLALNEAMACRRAVIASDRVGAAVDLVQSGKNGWVFRADDLQDLNAVLDCAVRMGREGLHAFGDESFGKIQLWTNEVQVEAIVRALKYCTEGESYSPSERGVLEGTERLNKAL